MSNVSLTLPTRRRLTEPLANPADQELRVQVERALADHYELDCEIGRGGMGVVYRALDKKLKRTVALKLLPPELAFRSDIKVRFMREAQTAAGLSHPNIVPIYRVQDEGQFVFFEMALVNGDNLAKRLHERGVLTIDETRRILREVADALAYAHDRGVVHRDIKPDNILLDGSSGRPMVTDFGIARAMDGSGDSRLTATGMAIGTPAYMSPEQAAGDREIDGRSDLYSLGILGYQMLTGEPPFSATSTPAMLVKHISEKPIPVQQRRSDVPTDLARSVMMLLEKEPENRFPNAKALVEALDNREAPPSRATPHAPPAPLLNAYVPPPGYGTAPQYAPPVERGFMPPMAPLAPMASMASLSTVGDYRPTLKDLDRWDAKEVAAFRKKLAPYLFVNGVVLCFALFGSRDFLSLTVLWSIYIAFKYAKLWSEGYDWRDVFKQPRDREITEVVEDGVEQFKSLYDVGTRERLRARRDQRRLAARGGASYGARTSMPMTALLDGPHGDRIRQSFADRDEIFRRLDSLGTAMPNAQREEVSRSAMALADKIQALAMALEESSRTDVVGARQRLESEIRTLEDAANPLERGSEERVRRLAMLKRQRRSLADIEQRHEALSGKLETCALALQNMRFDLMRLSAGPQMNQHITGLANAAMDLASSVDDAVYVADELGRMSGRPSGGNRAMERG